MNAPESAHEQDLNETITVLNARLESRHLEATEQSGQIGDLKRELAEAIEQRDLAIAHDRQPYPTAWAYDQAVKALESHRQRADVAEAEVERLGKVIAEYQRQMGYLADDVERVEQAGQGHVHGVDGSPWRGSFKRALRILRGES